MTRRPLVRKLCLLAASLLALGPAMAMPSDVPSTDEEKRYDGELNQLIDAVIRDPAFSRFRLNQEDVRHWFLHGRAGASGWRSASDVELGVAYHPKPGTQSLTGFTMDGRNSIVMDIFIEKTPMSGLPPDWCHQFKLTPTITAKWFVMAKGNVDALNRRISQLLVERFKIRYGG